MCALSTPTDSRRSGEATRLRRAQLNVEALEVAREAGDEIGVSLALVGLSRVVFRDGDYDRVRTLATEARELASRAGEPADETGPLHMLAAGTRLSGDYDRARELYLESLELNRRLGKERMVHVELHNLGHVELHRGDLAAAERAFAECSEAKAGSDDAYDRAMELLNRAALAAARGRTSAKLLDECEAILEQAGITLDPDDRFEVDVLRARR